MHLELRQRAQVHTTVEVGTLAGNGVVNTTAGLRCTVDEFLQAQQFIDSDAPPLVALRSLIAGKIK
jgi:hypothetical protein